jgi:hypothetical protein
MDPRLDPASDLGPPAEPGPPTPPRTLSFAVRLLLFALGWLLVLIGIAGLALPGIQGILTILIGASVLSVASQAVHRLLRRALRRWPALLSRLDRLRDKVHDRLSRSD